MHPNGLPIEPLLNMLLKKDGLPMHFPFWQLRQSSFFGRIDSFMRSVL
jgi:hypothetical protein